MTQIHITADKDVWTGASTTALLCARQAPEAVVVSAGNDEVLQRLRNGGVTVIPCPMSGPFASLNLSRALRHIEGTEFTVYVHSPEKIKAVESAIKLTGRREPMTLLPRVMPQFPTVEVAQPTDCLIMWLGNITEGCGLRELIDDLGRNADKQWRLRVVGQGKASVVTPIIKRTKALEIANRIEWVGYSDNPYRHMAGVSAAIVNDPDSVVAHEFAAAAIPVFTKLSDIL